MIEERTGDLFEADAEALVNPVNCVGVMGKGLALAFKRRFPQNFEHYARVCAQGRLQPGQLCVVPVWEKTYPHYIINFPTKRHWKDASRLEDIQAGLVELVAVVREHEFRSIAIPALGCGLGGLDWADVRKEIIAAVTPLEHVRVLLYGPQEG